MFYLTKHSTHFIYGYMEGRKERLYGKGPLRKGKERKFNIFNDALNTFYLQLYSITHMVKDHSDSEREETRCRHMGYSFQLATRVLYMRHPTDRITHTTAFVTPVMEHWLEREIAQWVHHEGSIRRSIALTTELPLAPHIL